MWPLLLSPASPVNLPLVRACRIAAFGLASLSLVAGTAALAGWGFGIRVLTTLGTQGLAMNPLSAICLVLLSVALLLSLPEHGGGVDVSIARVLSAIAGALAIAKLATAGSLDGPDAWLFRAAIDASTPVNRMAPYTALIVSALAAAIVLLDVEIRGRRPAQFLVILVLPITFMVLVGFLFGLSELYGWGAYTPMARNTALALSAVAMAILAGRIEYGVTAIFVRSGSAGITARRLLPAAILLPLVIGYARLAGQRLGLYGSEFGVVLFSLAMSTTFAVMVWWTASAVDRLDAAREEVDMRLQALIRHTPLGIVVLDPEGRVQLCNDAFVELFHYPQRELLGQKIDDLIAPADDAGETASLTVRGVAGESVRRATVRRRRDGRLVDVELFVVPLEVDGRSVGTYGVYRDLTGQQRRRETTRA
jgi:PAS domain S-box-containing protein